MKPLFSYGVLTSERVITLLVGRLPYRLPTCLEGYRANLITLEGWQPFPILLEDPSDFTHGYLYLDLNPKEILILDRFEGVPDGLFELRRIPEVCGVKAWAYLPTERLAKEGHVQEKWNSGNTAAVEAIYCESVIPEFKLNNRDLYE